MINLAIFLDFKQNTLSNNSKALLNFSNSLIKNNSNIKLYLYTLQDLKQCQISDTINVNRITSFTLENNIYYSANDCFDSLVLHLRDNNITHIFSTKSIAQDLISAKLAIILNFNLISNVKSLEIIDELFYFSKSIFSGKAIAKMTGTNESIIAVFSKGFTGEDQTDDLLVSKEIEIEYVTSKLVSTTKVLGESTITTEVLLSEADIVVGAGRGLKGPENWSIIENLAKKIKAATACSKPVSDLNWRPHHEHVGQTGIKITPKLYIACGISGAIQHLAGVNGSGTIIVINNDAEAPFTKYADYIVVGDLFEIVPELTKLFDEV